MLTIAPLRKTHKRKEFDCGNDELNTYIRTQASQDVRRDDSKCYVLSEEDGDEILGFFTKTRRKARSLQGGDIRRIYLIRGVLLPDVFLNPFQRSSATACCKV